MGLLYSLGAASPIYAQADANRSVILLVGDGMGMGIVGAAEHYARVNQKRELNLVRLAREGTSGWVTTHSADALVTDSAAAATALATGQKTKNGYVGIDAEGKPLETVAAIAKRAGKRVGLVTTARVSHATPAAFASHEQSREDENAIASQLVDGPVDVLLGGGARHWTPKTAAGSRADGRDLVMEAYQKGWQVVRTRQGLANAQASKVLGLFHKDHMSYMVDSPPENEPTLSDMTRQALRILSPSTKGFFLMVEGGRIDHALHSNDAPAAIREVLEFDEALGAALEYQRSHPETLVVVTADHETGGFGIVGSYRTPNPERKMRYPSLDSLSGVGAVSRSYDALMPQLLAASGSARIRQVAKARAGIDIGETWASRVATDSPWAPSYNWHETAAIAIGEQQVLPFGFSTSGHTASPVPVGASGPGSERLRGFIDNTEIGKALIEAVQK